MASTPSRVVATEMPDVRRWQAQALRYTATIARLRNALERADRRHRALRDRFDARRRAALDPEVLRQMLRARSAHPFVTTIDPDRASAREARFRDQSAPYREATEGTHPQSGFERIEIDGVAWWVPLEESEPDRIERARQQTFPYRAILQTREVALGGFMLDIGANIGRTSIPRVMLGDVRAVYAAEPEPANYACLVRNVLEHQLRGLVMPDRVAIGAQRGEALMKRSRYIGGHRLIHDGDNSRRSIPVEVWPLDDWMAHLGIAPETVTFVKVDTQGSEVAVLRGASSLLARRHVSWFIEVAPNLLERAGASLRDLLELAAKQFGSFIDVGAPDGGPRVRSTDLLAESLSYLGTRQQKTDLLLFTT